MIWNELKKNNERFLKNIKEKGLFKAMKIEITETQNEFKEIDTGLGNPINFFKDFIKKITFWGFVKFLIITFLIVFGLYYFIFLYLLIGIFLLLLLVRFIF